MPPSRDIAKVPVGVEASREHVHASQPLVLELPPHLARFRVGRRGGEDDELDRHVAWCHRGQMFAVARELLPWVRFVTNPPE